jgi:hypothetical protein
MSERHAAAVESGENISPVPQEQWCAWVERAQESLDAGLAPASAEGRAFGGELARASAGQDRDGDDPGFRVELADRIAAGGDTRAERYWQLIGIMNGWPPVPTQQPAVNWLVAALRASATQVNPGSPA